MTFHHYHQYLRRGEFVYDLNAAAPLGDDDSSTSSTMRTVSANKSQLSSMIELVDIVASSPSSTSSTPASLTQDNPQDDLSNESLSATTRTTTKRKRVVRFDETFNQEYENTIMYFEDCRFLWYSSKQLQAFKDSNYAHAEEIRQSEKAVDGPFSYKRLLCLTYKACCQSIEHDSEHDSDNEIEWMEDKNSVDALWTPIQQEALELLLRHLALNHLGLDRLIVRSIALDIHWRRREMKRIILHLQDNMTTTNNNHKDKDNMAETIRSRCQALSRPARLYARRLAQTQLTVV